MRKQKVLVVFLCGLVLLTGMWRNEKVQEASAQAEKAGTIALTFDDGPHCTYTKELLAGLRERGVKATFFLIGENIEGNEDLVRQMSEDGHLIGCHTYSHVDLTKCTLSEALCEVEMTDDLITGITGKVVEYVRPPFGNWKDSLAEALPLTVVRWTVDPEDWKDQNREHVVAKVKKNVKDGSIILLHDNYRTSVEAALDIVDDLQKEGYEFVTMDELLLD